jgi:hypothetical protein
MKHEYYQLRAQSYLSDGIYIWEDLDAECETLEECLNCRNYAMLNYPEYVDYEIIHRVETIVSPAKRGIESDWDR